MIQTCKKCRKSKQHYGNGMCVACWTRMKRQTDPKYHLMSLKSARKWRSRNRERANYLACLAMKKRYATDPVFKKKQLEYQRRYYAKKHKKK
jgi:hypothetical protein